MKKVFVLMLSENCQQAVKFQPDLVVPRGNVYTFGKQNYTSKLTYNCTFTSLEYEELTAMP